MNDILDAPQTFLAGGHHRGIRIAAMVLQIRYF